VGQTPRTGVPAERASGSRLGLRLPRLYPHRRRARAAGAGEARRRQDHRPEHPDRLGRRVPAGAGRQLTLRLRLLAAAAGIVAVSLLLAGALTWVMVRDLEYRSVQDQLDRQGHSPAMQVRLNECLAPAVAGTALCRPDSATDFTERLNSRAPQLGSTRLIL